MSNFVKGIELCEGFFNSCARGIIEEHFPNLRYTAGLIGYGSDVLGYDDPVSTDHMWGPRFYLFLDKEDICLKDSIFQVLSENLPYTYSGYSVNFTEPDPNDCGVQHPKYINEGKVNSLIFIQTFDDYLIEQLGTSDLDRIKPFAWLAFSEHRLLSLISGKLFVDGLNCADILCVSSMYEAMLSFMDKEFCLVILDACISAEDDHKLLKAMRKARTTPILILSSQSCHVERLKVLQAGAHAYIGHPYSLEECLAQAQALMQLYCDLKPQKEVCYTLAFGKSLIIDPFTRQVQLNGENLHFTRKEFDLLFCLASNPGQVFSREQLYNQVWDEHSAYNVDDVVKSQIRLLRQKLSVTGKDYIQNVWGVGYRFNNDSE